MDNSITYMVKIVALVGGCWELKPPYINKFEYETLKFCSGSPKALPKEILAHASDTSL